MEKTVSPLHNLKIKNLLNYFEVMQLFYELLKMTRNKPQLFRKLLEWWHLYATDLPVSPVRYRLVFLCFAGIEHHPLQYIAWVVFFWVSWWTNDKGKWLWDITLGGMLSGQEFVY